MDDIVFDILEPITLSEWASGAKATGKKVGEISFTELCRLGNEAVETIRKDVEAIPNG